MWRDPALKKLSVKYEKKRKNKILYFDSVFYSDFEMLKKNVTLSQKLKELC